MERGLRKLITVTEIMVVKALFTKFVKNEYYLLHVCLSACNNMAPTVRIFTKFEILVLFKNLSRKFKFLQNLAKITIYNIY